MDKAGPSLMGQIEALLFLYGEPVAIKKLAEVLNVKNSEIQESLENIKSILQSNDRGLAIVVSDNRAQLVTKPALSEILSNTIKGEVNTNLTPASLETLAIVAYLGPCRRSLIEHIRGVNSSFILRSLLVRGIVERKPDPRRKNTFLYQVTFNLLRHIGVDSQKTLPEYEKYREFTKFFTESPVGYSVDDKNKEVGKRE